jgi:LruC domain-containing protein
MKKTVSILVGFALTISTFSQVSNNFESGNRAIDKNNCWQFNSTTVTASTEIEGNYNGQSGILSGGTHFLISPWVKFTKPGNLTFSHRMSADNGTSRILNVYLMDQTDQIIQVLYSYDYEGDKSKLINSVVNLNLSGVYRIKWQFGGTGGSSKGLLDLIYIPGDYYSDPTANNGSGNCSMVIERPDTDKDGVVDSEDAYPEDPFRAYNNEFPGGEWGTLAFEDLWPAKGDYDFNDLVVDYQCIIVADSKNEIVEIKARFITRALGASFHNALGFSLMGIPSKSVIRAVNSFDYANSRKYFTIADNGVEAGQSLATIIVFEDAFKVLPHPGSGTGVNTTIGSPYVEPKLVEILITLKENGQTLGDPVNFLEWPLSNFNFFMVAKADEGRGIEIHLADYQPTDLADKSMFGTQDDRSNPGQLYTYRSKNNLPWAISTMTSFEYPIEKADLVKTHLKFGPWAETSGRQYSNWYLDLSGYTNPDLMYKH